MHKSLRKKLDSLPPLEKVHPSEECKICGSRSSFFDVVDFHKHCSFKLYEFGTSGIYVEYYRCDSCGFLFTTDFDDWSRKDFARYIYNQDYIKVDPEYDGSRAVDNADTLERILEQCKDCRILDYGAGQGRLAEELRQRGFSVESYDPFSSPEVPPGKFDVVVLLEVIEHTTWPKQTLAAILELLNDDGVLLIGQALQPDDIYRIRGSWWYLGPRNGHISTYSERTFMKIAGDLGLRYYRGGALYCFVRGKPSEEVMSLTKHFVATKRLCLVADSQIAEGEFLGFANGEFQGHEQGEFGHYRWSSGTSVSWVLPADDQNAVTVEIPFCMFLTANYPEQCKVLVDGQPVGASVVMERVGGAIRFDLPPSGRAREVHLFLPPPSSPRELHGADDDRQLGLAIMTRENYVR